MREGGVEEQGSPVSGSATAASILSTSAVRSCYPRPHWQSSDFCWHPWAHQIWNFGLVRLLGREIAGRSGWSCALGRIACSRGGRGAVPQRSAAFRSVPQSCRRIPQPFRSHSAAIPHSCRRIPQPGRRHGRRIPHLVPGFRSEFRPVARSGLN